MAYGFAAEETVPDSFTRVSREQLDRAVRALSEELEGDPVSAVHSARKAIKKERALLRLAHGNLPNGQRRAENAALREAARELSGTRDSDVMIQALDGLHARFPGQLPEKTFSAAKERFEELRREHREQRGASALSSEAVQDLGAVQVRIDDWRLTRDGWRGIEPGLLRTYRRGRQAERIARKEPSLENLHQWRKRVKDLWYELRLLSPVGGETVRGQAKEAGQLGDLLGDDHDLGVLRESLSAQGAHIAADVDALMALIDYRRGQLQGEAVCVGRRLYAEKPTAFARRMSSYWKAGQAEARARQDRHPAELAEATREPHHG